MYAQVRTTRFQPEHCEAALTLLQEYVVPTIRRQAGNRGVTQLIDRTSGTAILITLWETEAAMYAPFDRSHYMREQSVVIAGHATALPTWEIYQVETLA